MITHRPLTFGSTHVIQNVRTPMLIHTGISPLFDSARAEFGEFLGKFGKAALPALYTLRRIDDRVEFKVADGDDRTFEYDGIEEGERPFTKDFLPNLSDTLGLPLSNTGAPDCGSGFSINA